MIRLVPVFVVLLLSRYALAQDLKMNATIESIEPYSLKTFKADRYSLSLIGSVNDTLVFIYENLKDRTEKILSLDNNTLVEISSRYPFAVQNYVVGLSVYVSDRLIKDELFFFGKDHFDDTDEYGYTKMYISFSGKEYYLDSIYNADKKIHSSFSSDGRYLLVNTLNTLSDYYNPAQDNRIMVYDLSEIGQGRIKKEYIACMLCSDSYLVGNQVFFTIGRKDGYEGYSNKDIYVAPWGSLKDSVKIADNTNIIAVAPDGKKILGTRFWDRQKITAVIVDTDQKKYQLLLGRDYAGRKALYSYYENKFAFDFKGHLVYVDFPDQYPFDALRWRNEEIPDWTEQDFWNQFTHSPLPDN